MRLRARVDLVPCCNCHARPGTEAWVGEGGAFAASHGGIVYWCLVCVLTAQLAHARTLAANIPELERQLAEATQG